MTVSVIIPTHNRSEMLVNAINSAFAQRDVDVDVIVVDDASTDSTAKVMASYEGVTYLRNLNSLGPGKTRQKGYLAAKGEYIVFLDDDDYYTDFFFYRIYRGSYSNLFWKYNKTSQKLFYIIIYDILY